MRILIVDDDKYITEIYKEYLSAEGYAVDSANTGEEGEILAESVHYDAIIVDVVLPGKNGFEVCRDLRRKKIQTPIILISGKRKDDPDIIQGLDCGADDYLLKPVSSEMLLAKIRAVLRTEYTTKNPKVEIGNLLLDTIHRQVWQGEKELELTRKEYTIFEYLVYHPNIVINRTELEQHAYNMTLDAGSNIIDQHIKNLRKKLDNRILIEPIRGLGYRLKA